MIKAIRALLIQLIERIDAGNSDLTKQEANTVLELLKHYTEKDEYISKYSAYNYLGISRASFDAKVKEGKLPKGKKVVGFKELMWTKKDLDNYLNRR